MSPQSSWSQIPILIEYNNILHGPTTLLTVIPAIEWTFLLSIYVKKLQIFLRWICDQIWDVSNCGNRSFDFHNQVDWLTFQNPLHSLNMTCSVMEYKMAHK